MPEIVQHPPAAAENVQQHIHRVAIHVSRVRVLGDRDGPCRHYTLHFEFVMTVCQCACKLLI